MPTTPRRRLEWLTNTRATTYRRCSLEHHLAFEAAIRPRAEDAEALRFGNLFHRGLEAWWLAYPYSGEQLTAAVEAMRPHAADEYDLVRAEALMVGYDQRWAGAEDIEVIAVEHQFTAPLVNPLTGASSRSYELAGKLDALVLNRGDGRAYVVEHKTTSANIDPGGTYWEQLRIDPQISTYFAGVRALGYEPAGCLYDVIHKTKHAPKRATPEEKRRYTLKGYLHASDRDRDETPEEYGKRLKDEIIGPDPDKYYRRGFVVRLPDEEREAAFDVWQTARRMREDRAAGVYPRNPNSCERYGRMCGYFPVCTHAASLDDATMYARVDNIHPELAAPAAPSPSAAEGEAAE